MKLNVGCGEFHAPGWVNIDVHRGGPVQPDRVASLLALPFDDDSAELVYCGHVLEHIPERDLPAALAETRRVLADWGTLMVVGPDIDRARERFPDMVPGILAGGGRWPGDAHAWTANEHRTRGHLERAGFTVTPLDITAVGAPWPVVAHVGWQFALRAT